MAEKRHRKHLDNTDVVMGGRNCDVRAVGAWVQPEYGRLVNNLSDAVVGNQTCLLFFKYSFKESGRRSRTGKQIQARRKGTAADGIPKQSSTTSANS